MPNRCPTSGITHENNIVLLSRSQSLIAVPTALLGPCSYLELLLRSIDSRCFRLGQTNYSAVLWAIRTKPCVPNYAFHISNHTRIVPRRGNAENKFSSLCRPSGIWVAEDIPNVTVYAAKIISKPASCVLDFGSVWPWVFVFRIQVKLEEVFDICTVFVLVALEAPFLHLPRVFIILKFRWHLVWEFVEQFPGPVLNRLWLRPAWAHGVCDTCFSPLGVRKGWKIKQDDGNCCTYRQTNLCMSCQSRCQL